MPFQRSFWIIGETTLAIRCADALVERGQVVRGLITAHGLAAEWARERGIAVVPFAQALSALSATPYDYLLSIVNSRILGADILATPALGAINYHDGPLPRYAGMHSTSWAILNEETTHGVTWHNVVELVDAGPIYRQRIVSVDPDETALSLNAKSYEAALESFLELAEDIGAGRLEGREQDLAQRTCYAHLERPPAAGLIDWTRPASAVSALVRALDFGVAYPNPLGRAKVRCGSTIYLCGRVRRTDRPAPASPGTVSGIDASGIAVAAQDREVVIESLAALDGTPLDLADVIARERLAVGAPLGDTAPEIRAGITARNHELAAYESHWLRALRRVRPLELPYRKATGTSTGAFHRVRLSIPACPGRPAERAGERIAAVAAAFAALLSRLTLEVPVHLAFEHPGLRPENAELGQLFATRVPVTLDTRRELSFADHAAATGKHLADAQARGTFARDLRARHPELMSRPAALPVVVRLDPAPDDVATGAELFLDITADGRSAELRSDTGLVSAEDAARFGAQLETFLTAVSMDPSLPLGGAPIVPESEHVRLVSEWNATAEPYPKDLTVHALFEQCAQSIPGEPAVIAGASRLTYAELNARADAWARALRSHGIGRDAIVGLRTGRSPELVVGLLAVLKAGGAYLPLDLSLPPARTQFMVEDAGVRVVLTTAELRDDLASCGCTVLCLDEPPSLREPARAPGLPADPESLAYVIYTSGSTGAPKGVLVHHRAVVNYLWWASRFYGATDGAGSPVHSPVAFDLTVTSLIAPLVSGRPVHLLDERLGVDALAGALRDGRDFTLVKLT
ncbi:MAG TPA: AMP-binding protein, partial [Gemmatimonadales bacterium]|nr:AMP-binding protein [Gemmatimonadales bacterium]